MAEPKKVTIQFASIADNVSDEDILINGSPIEIYRSVDHVNDLHTISNLPTDRDVYVYVRNVIDSNTRTQSAFYQYNHQDKTWKEVLLGTHSHENKELLDQLGNIDVENLPIGQNKVLTLKRVDMDNSENSDIAYKYEFNWIDSNVLPEIPEDLLSGPVSLSYENGSYVWAKTGAIPTQTFQYKQVIVPNDGNTIVIEDISYDEDYKDTLMIFDNGMLITDYEIKKFDNSDGLKCIRIIANDNIFEKDEKITALVIKNGIDGVINTLADQYVTKAEAVQWMSQRAISLYEYATKNDLKKKADRQHSHSQYSRVGHTHDERYAMYSHTHDGIYVYKSEVYSIISGILSNLADEEINVEDLLNNTFEEAIMTLQKSIDEKISNELFYSEIQRIRNDFSTDNIKVDIEGYETTTLTEYLEKIEDTLDNITVQTTTEMVEVSEPIIVKLGENGELGGYKDGDIIDSRTPLHAVLTTLLQKKIDPILNKPEVKLEIQDVENIIFEPGMKTEITVIPRFIQNDAGKLIKMNLNIAQFVDNKGTIYSDIEVYENTPYKMAINVLEELSVEMILTAEYEQGEAKYDNLYNKDEFKYRSLAHIIPAGSVECTEQIRGERPTYIGEYSSKAGYSKMKKIHTPKKDFEFEVKTNLAVNDIVIAIPYKENIIIDEIFYKNQHCDVDCLFSYKDDEMIPGLNNYNPVRYIVRHLTVDDGVRETMKFKVFIKDGENVE